MVQAIIDVTAGQYSLRVSFKILKCILKFLWPGPAQLDDTYFVQWNEFKILFSISDTMIKESSQI